MTAQLHLALPASGKTRQMLQRVRAALAANPLAQVWVIVPDRLHAVGMRARLAQSGNTVGVRVGTFGDLYEEILDLTGQSYPVAPDAALHMLTRRLIARLAAGGKLPYYLSIHDKAGFLQVVQDRFAELKRAMVWPEDFERYLREQENHADGLEELATIYAAYQEELHSLGWADLEGVSWLAVEALEGRPVLLNDWALIAVDGFVEFTPAQLRTLELLARRVRSLYITLPGEPKSRRSTLLQARSSLKSLVRDLAPEIYSPRQQPRLPKALAYLEQNLFEPDAKGFTKEGLSGTLGQIHLVEVRTTAEEAREALRWVKACHLRDGVPLERCAIFTQDPNLHGAALKEAAAEFGLPLHVTWGRSLPEEPALDALLELLALPVRDYPRRQTLDTIRSPFFNLSRVGLLMEDAGHLEEVSFAGQVSGGAQAWLEAFRYARLAARKVNIAADPEEAVEEDMAPRSLPSADELERLQTAFVAFMERMHAPGLRSIYEWIHWLEDLLEDLEFATNCDQPKLLRALRTTLAGLALGESVAGHDPQDYAAFLATLSGALQGRSLIDRTPATPTVLAMRMAEGWGLRFDVIAVLGLSEGIFPTVERVDPFIDEVTRAQLQLEPRLNRNQASIFYQVLTRADQKILLTRPYLAEGGESWESSPYWNAVVSLFPDAVYKLNSEAPRRLADAASPAEALFWATRTGLDQLPPAGLFARAEIIHHGRGVLAARMAEQRQGPYEGFPAGLSEELSRYYNPEHTWSASRLETYAGCPQRFYVENVLKLEAREAPEPGFDAAQLGTMLHNILEQAYRRAEDPSDAEAVVTELLSAAQAEFARAPATLGFRPTPLWDDQQANLLTRLEATVRALAESSHGWQPSAFELPFGLKGERELCLETEQGPVRLRGIIDRVDRDGSGRLRIIDYKTGGSGLDPRDLLEGRRLQLPLYALAARDALQLGEPVEGFYWKIQSAEAGRLKLSSFEDGEARGPHAAMELAIRFVERILSGVLKAEFPPEPSKGGCPSYCPAKVWCWRYEKSGF